MRLVAATLTLASIAVASPNFTRDVAPIFYKKCVGCHRPGELAPMSLLEYKTARPWAKALRAAVLTRKMPPWFADPRYETLVVRTDAALAPEALISSVRRQLHDIDPDLPIAHVRTMSQQVDDAVAQPRFQAILLAAFSTLALVLGSVGIFEILDHRGTQQHTPINKAFDDQII